MKECRPLSALCVLFGLFATAIAAAGPVNTDQSTWAWNCVIRNDGDQDSALNALGGAPAAVGQVVATYDSTGDPATNQQWILAPDSTDPTLWYIIPASSVGNVHCLTVNQSAGQPSGQAYLSLCQNLATQEFRFGQLYQGVRRLYHIIPALAYQNGQSIGLIPNSYTLFNGNPVIAWALYGTSVSGVTSTVPQPSEGWRIQYCFDSDGNAIDFGSGWSINGRSTGY